MMFFLEKFKKKDFAMFFEGGDDLIMFTPSLEFKDFILENKEKFLKNASNVRALFNWFVYKEVVDYEDDLMMSDDEIKEVTKELSDLMISEAERTHLPMKTIIIKDILSIDYYSWHEDELEKDVRSLILT